MSRAELGVVVLIVLVLVLIVYVDRTRDRR